MELAQKSEAGRFIQVLRKNGSKVPYLFTLNGKYYSLFRHGRKIIRRRCPYFTQSDAEKWVIALRRELVEGVLSSQMSTRKMRSEFPSLRQVADAYLAMVPGRYATKGTPNPRTAQGNIWKIGIVLAEGNGVKDGMDLRLGPDVISAKTVERFILGRLANCADPLEQKRARVTAASTLVGARSLFASWTRSRYLDAGILIPKNVDEFCEGVTPMKPDHYRTPPEELTRTTLERAAQLPAQERAMFILCYNFGLRRSEAQAAKWDWKESYLETQAIRIDVREDYAGSKNKKSRRVPATLDVWAELEAMRDGDYIIPGAPRPIDRIHVAARLSKWMRSVGWDEKHYKKTLHELRKIAGSTWCQKANIQRAAEWLGDTMAVVEHYYVDVIGRAQPVEM